MAEVKRLIEGYKQFYKNYYLSGSTLYDNLTKEGQSPKTLIIACSDSRVDPSIVTNAEPGDIFVIRNVANMVPPYEDGNTGLHGVSAALEFAVCILNVKHVVILGHSHCAGVGALLDRESVSERDFIGKWVDIGQKAKEKTMADNPGKEPKDLQHECERESVLHSLDNLLTFPWIKDRVEEKSLKLHGWYFSIGNGELMEYNPITSNFKTIDPQAAKSA